MFQRKIKYFLFALIFLIPLGSSCSATKDVEERRNYMIPKKSDIPANSRYKDPGKRKSYTQKSPSSRRKSYF